MGRCRLSVPAGASDDIPSTDRAPSQLGRRRDPRRAGAEAAGLARLPAAAGRQGLGRRAAGRRRLAHPGPRRRLARAGAAVAQAAQLRRARQTRCSTGATTRWCCRRRSPVRSRCAWPACARWAIRRRHAASCSRAASRITYGGHALISYWELACRLLRIVQAPPREIGLQLAPADVARADAVLREHGVAPGFVVICPFAGGTFEKLDKTWPQFPQFTRELLSSGRQVVACPGPGEEAVLREHYPGVTTLRGHQAGRLRSDPAARGAAGVQRHRARPSGGCCGRTGAERARPHQARAVGAMGSYGPHRAAPATAAGHRVARGRRSRAARSGAGRVRSHRGIDR